MACKIVVEKDSVEGGERSWFTEISDFSSLQARLASIDTCLNPQGIDSTLYNVYKDGSKMSDLHSVTGFNTFCGSIGMECYDIVDDKTGKEYKGVCDLSRFRIKRFENTMEVSAKELMETDEILEYL